METVQLIAALFGVGGVGSIALVLVQGLMRHMDGSAGREQTRSADAIAQRDDAWARMTELEERSRLAIEEAEKDARIARREADGALSVSRRVKEYASRLRGILHENGIEPPPWPVTACPTPPDTYSDDQT